MPRISTDVTETLLTAIKKKVEVDGLKDIGAGIEQALSAWVGGPSATSTGTVIHTGSIAATGSVTATGTAAPSGTIASTGTV